MYFADMPAASRHYNYSLKLKMEAVNLPSYIWPPYVYSGLRTKWRAIAALRIMMRRAHSNESLQEYSGS